jgi:hypothetical protein
MQLGNPYNVEPEQDRLTVPSDRPAGWSENLVCSGNDPATGLAFYAHFSRIAPDPAIWEGVLIVHPPGGGVLVSRSFGAQQGRDIADAGALTFRCVEPCQTWRLEFDGMVRRLDPAALNNGMLTDGPVEQLRIALDVTSVLPPWSPGGASDFAHLHIEQVARLDGTIGVGGETLAFSAPGIRDHSRGPRAHSRLPRAVWSYGFVPSGKSFIAARIWDPASGPLFEAGVMFDGDRIHDVTTVGVPTLDSVTGEPRDFELSLSGDFDTVHIAGAVRATTPFTLLAPTGQAFGFDGSNPNGTVLVEAPITFECGSERGFGWLERLAQVHYLGGVSE